ncbi:MAG: hypothetical protein ACLVJZ_04850 [[Clostridium] leptum]
MICGGTGKDEDGVQDMGYRELCVGWSMLRFCRCFAPWNGYALEIWNFETRESLYDAMSRRSG